MTQTSETNSMAISILKHLNGDPLDTARTCLGPMLRHKALVDMVPRPPSHTDGTGALVGTRAKVLLRAGAEGLLCPNNRFMATGCHLRLAWRRTILMRARVKYGRTFSLV